MTIQEILQNAAVAERDDQQMLDGINGFDLSDYETEMPEAVEDLSSPDYWE